MKNLKLFGIAALLLFVANNSYAQDEDYIGGVYEEGDQLWGFSYSFGFPSGDFQDFIEETSFRGFHIDYEYLVRDNLSVGFNGAYTLYNETNDRSSYEFERGNTGGAISAKIWRYTHLVPLHVTGKYYFAPDPGNWAHIFGGLGAGMSYINQEAWIGLSTIREESWRFSMAPELGLDLQTGGRVNIQISGQYYWVPNGLQLVEESNLETWNLRIGFRKWIY